MFKVTAIVSLILIGSTLWAASLSCDSCGSECASACGTRHFRSCCFNYLRRKRGPDAVKLYTASRDMNVEGRHKHKFPVFMVENIPAPEQWLTNLISSEYKPYPSEDTVENHLYDA